MDTLSNVESETRRSESFAHTGPDNFSSYRDAPPGLLQKRLLDDGDKEKAHGGKKGEGGQEGEREREREREREGEKKERSVALFDGENSPHTGRRQHENHAGTTYSLT